MILNPNGEVLSSRDELEDDTIQRLVSEYCKEWNSLKNKRMGLPLANILRQCAEQIERELK
jgi:hypothetical protein